MILVKHTYLHATPGQPSQGRHNRTTTIFRYVSRERIGNMSVPDVCRERYHTRSDTDTRQDQEEIFGIYSSDDRTYIIGRKRIGNVFLNQSRSIGHDRRSDKIAMAPARQRQYPISASSSRLREVLAELGVGPHDRGLLTKGPYPHRHVEGLLVDLKM